MAKVPTNPAIIIDNSAGLIDPLRNLNSHTRDVNLFIKQENENRHYSFLAYSHLFDTGGAWLGRASLTQTEVVGLARDCQGEWERAIRSPEAGLSLLDAWDLSGTPDEPHRRLLGKLAVAGRQLFEALFYPRKQPEDPMSAGLPEIGNKLEQLTAAGSYWIRVTSDDFYIPWNLLYSLPLEDLLDGMDAVPQGFWGYQHLVEHVPVPVDLAARYRPEELDFTEPVQVGFHVDENIDGNARVPCNSLVKDLLDSYERGDVGRLSRPTSRALYAALRRPEPLPDHILYFCCHAEGERLGATDRDLPPSRPCFMLTDREVRITPQDITLWLQGKYLERHPIVFLNACQSGRMDTLFYYGFAKTFFDSRASTFIGTQASVPAVFAGKFARSFLKEFFKGGHDEPRRVGDVLFARRRKYLDQYKNPLGLLYSLYQGADVFLPRPLRVKDVQEP